jgi:hypothetical protein
MPASLTISKRPYGISRTSSGVSNRFRITGSNMTTPLSSRLPNDVFCRWAPARLPLDGIHPPLPAERNETILPPFPCGHGEPFIPRRCRSDPPGSEWPCNPTLPRLRNRRPRHGPTSGSWPDAICARALSSRNSSLSVRASGRRIGSMFLVSTRCPATTPTWSQPKQKSMSKGRGLPPTDDQNRRLYPGRKTQPLPTPLPPGALLVHSGME